MKPVASPVGRATICACFGAALCSLWALIGFGLSLEFLYLFKPLGIAGKALIAAVAWFLEGRAPIGLGPGGGGWRPAVD